MSKNVLIISASPRKDGSSGALADAFLNGAKEAGNTVEKVSLYNKAIGACKGCLACQKTGLCVIRDDAEFIVEKMRNADVLVFATPVYYYEMSGFMHRNKSEIFINKPIYYYEMSGQMKTMLERANPLFSADYAFRDVYFLSTAADNEEGFETRAVNGLEGWIESFPKAHLAGTVFAGGVSDAEEIDGHSSLQKAYEMGKAI